MTLFHYRIIIGNRLDDIFTVNDIYGTTKHDIKLSLHDFMFNEISQRLHGSNHETNNTKIVHFPNTFP